VPQQIKENSCSRIGQGNDASNRSAIHL
jgi:hypothetical protein